MGYLNNLNPDIFHINLYHLSAMATLFSGFTFALLLACAKRESQTANLFLSAALAVIVLKTGGLSPIFLPALGPLLYFYVRRMTAPNLHFGRKDVLHFCPLLVAYWMPGWLVIISVVIYLYLSHRLIQQFYNRLQPVLMDRPRFAFRRLDRALHLLALLCVFWLFNDAWSFALAFVLIGMAAEVMLKLDSSTQLATPITDRYDAKEKSRRLKEAVAANRLYADAELTLTTLAVKLNVHPHDLSRIINVGMEKNFNDFINEFRVRETARKMRDPAHDRLTLLGIAYESGFNSQRTFNRVFKEMTGKTPVEYKNSLKKELPNDKLAIPTHLPSVILRSGSPPSWAPVKLNRSYMFKNYFKIARRNLVRNKSYAAINITGLAVGIAVCMTIFIIIQYQTSVDGFHAKKDRIYRVLTEYHHAESGIVSYGKEVPLPLPRGLKTAFPQIEQIAPIFASQDDQLLIPDDNGTTVKTFKEQRGVFFTAPSFFKIFDFPLLAGSYASLKDPNNVLLTKEIAEKYFGDWKTAIGKTIKLQAGGYIFEHGTEVLKVSGILATIPANTDFQLKLVVAYGTGFTGSIIEKSTNWEDRTTSDFGCYILLPPNTPVGNFNQQLRAYSQKVQSPVNKDNHLIQPLSAVHYDTQVGNYSNKTIGHQLLNVLWLIAAFILLIACVNFINLATAQAVNRAKEVGVRKVLGSNKSQLQIQFIVETFLIVTSAVILAVVVTILALPYVNQLLELSLSFNIISNPSIILFLLAVTIVVTALAGFYPAMVLSRFNPVNALKNKLTSNTVKGVSLRRGLVVFQFIIAQALIIGTLIIVKQMDYFMDQPLGFDKDAIINVPYRVDSLRIARMGYLKNQLLSINGVQAVSFSSNTPVENGSDMWATFRYNHAAKETDFKAITKLADNDYVPAYKLTLIAGRNLQASNMTREFLVNESLLKSLGIKKPEDILNKEISMWNDQIKCSVVGVLKDFNDRSFRNDLAPLLITTDVAMYNQVGIKLSTTNISPSIQSVKKIFEQTLPDFLFEYKFLDEKIGSFYKQENQLAALYKIFAAIAIFLSCLGLYGLASFMAVQRIKEVGIRKVLGATADNIVYLFSKEFIILIAIAFAIAAPIAWYYMHQWLQAYVYRINISWWLFAAGGLASIAIALATISFQAVKAAMANPVKSLRSE